MANNNILAAIDVATKDSLVDPKTADTCLLSELPEDVSPLKELPRDPLVDIYYVTRYEPRCVLCKSPFRTIAEHVYLNNGWRPHAVMSFFREYFNARVTWECVDKHMRTHCDLSESNTSGIKKLTERRLNAGEWHCNELDLAITGLIDEIDEIKGMNFAKKPQMKIKQATLLRQIYRDLAVLTEKRDAQASSTVNIQKVLMDIWQEMPTQEAKQIIWRHVKDIQNTLNGG